MADTTKHTPSPWIIQTSENGGGFLIKPVPGQVIAQLDPTPNMKHDAALLAAAPELLEQLKIALNDLEEWKDYNKMQIDSYDHPAQEGEQRLQRQITDDIQLTIDNIKTVIKKATTLPDLEETPKKTIELSWHVDDIKTRAEQNDIDITDQQALEILHLIDKRHDASVGVNWDVIDVYIEEYLKSN